MSQVPPGLGAGPPQFPAQPPDHAAGPLPPDHVAGPLPSALEPWPQEMVLSLKLWLQV